MGRWIRKIKARKKKAKDLQNSATENMQENVTAAEALADRDLGTSQMANVQADPALVAAQQQALSQLGTISREGFTDLDRQALDQAQRQASQYEQSQRGAAMDAAARRGDASGGNALMASLAAQQGGADRASQFATDIGLAGRQRALAALGEYGNMAGNMRDQSFGEGAQRAGAQDSFMQWATGQRSADTALAMGARSDQAAYQSEQAQRLRDQAKNRFQSALGGIQQLGQLGGQLYTAFGGSGGGGASGGSAPAPMSSGGFHESTHRTAAPQTQSPAAEQQAAANRYTTARRYT